MTLFSMGCIVLKAKRAKMPRDVHAPWVTCFFGLTMVVLALIGNLLGNPKVLSYFMIYLVVVVGVMFIMLERVRLLRGVLAVLKSVLPSPHGKPRADTGTEPINSVDAPPHTGARGGRTITEAIMAIKDVPVVFFSKKPDMTILNKAVLYVRTNEQCTHHLIIMHVYEDEEAAPELAQFREMTALFDHIYPKLKMDFVAVKGAFDPAMIEWIASTLHIPTNMMFIKQPTNYESHRVSTKGIRVITA